MLIFLKLYIIVSEIIDIFLYVNQDKKDQAILLFDKQLTQPKSKVQQYMEFKYLKIHVFHYQALHPFIFIF
jgi:hypothetical protein